MSMHIYTTTVNNIYIIMKLYIIRKRGKYCNNTHLAFITLTKYYQKNTLLLYFFNEILFVNFYAQI